MKKIELKQSYDHRNDYYLACDKVDKQQKYSICLMMIQMGRESNYEKSFEDCRPFLRDGTCPAMAMRKEEVKKGEAIYFAANDMERFETARLAKAAEIKASRVVSVDKSSDSYHRGFTGQTPSFNTSHTKQARPAKKRTERTMEPPSESLESMLATKLSRVERLAEKAKKEKVAIVTATQKPAKAPALTLLPGEKPIDFAKRLREARRVA